MLVRVITWALLLPLDPAVVRIKYISRRFRYAIKPLMKVEIERLCDQNILEPLALSEYWATPSVLVVKTMDQSEYEQSTINASF